MRFLYLDDYGKINAKDNSSFFVLAGFSVDEGRWHRVVRQISGAKANFLPTQGKPSNWEVKSTDFLSSNNWKRSRRRGLCQEIANILERNSCHVYAVSLEKKNAIDALDERKFFPLAIQRLVYKFNSEVVNNAETGSVVCDWWDYRMDRHTTNCISSAVISNKMEFIRGGVTFGDSAALIPLQAADIVAGTIGRSLSGQAHLDDFADRLRSLRFVVPGQTDLLNYPVDSIVKLF
jgi:hypothetical protein